jgi:hypothetical protein
MALVCWATEIHVRKIPVLKRRERTAVCGIEAHWAEVALRPVVDVEIYRVCTRSLNFIRAGDKGNISALEGLRGIKLSLEMGWRR